MSQVSIELWREDIYCNRYLVKEYTEDEREQAEKDLTRFIEKGHHQSYELIEVVHNGQQGFPDGK